ncbi:unnamed protein product [Prunus armeniaca]
MEMYDNVIDADDKETLKFMSKSSAPPKLGERLPRRARDGSNAGDAAQFRGGSLQPEEAQGQVLPGLKPESGQRWRHADASAR